MRKTITVLILCFGWMGVTNAQNPAKTLIKGFSVDMPMNPANMDSLSQTVSQFKRAGFTAVWLPALKETGGVDRPDRFDQISPELFYTASETRLLTGDLSEPALLELTSAESLIDEIIASGLALYSGRTAPPVSDTLDKTPYRFDLEMAGAYFEMESGGDEYDIRKWHQDVPFDRKSAFNIIRYPQNLSLQSEGVTPGSRGTANIKRMLAYAHMLTHPSDAVVMWNDYNSENMDAINRLVQIRNHFAIGHLHMITDLSDEQGDGLLHWACTETHGPECAETDRRQLYVAQRLGTDRQNGLIVAINKHSEYYIDFRTTIERWAGEKLYDITGNAPDTLQVDRNGNVLIRTRANSYHVYVPLHFELAEDSNYSVSWLSPGSTDITHDSLWTAEFRFRNESIFSIKDIHLLVDVKKGEEHIQADTIKVDFIRAGSDALLKLPTILLEEYGEYEVTLKWLSLSGNEPLKLLMKKLEYSEYVETEVEMIPVPDTAPELLLHEILFDFVIRDAKLSWNSIPKADSYMLELTMDPEFELDVISEMVSDTSFVFSNLIEAQLYFWRVLAQNVSGAGPWSEASSFFTRTLEPDDLNGLSPEHTELFQNYPNPFNPATVIRFNLSSESYVRLEVYDLIGRRVALLVDEVRAAGRYDAIFDSNSLPSGVYLSRLEVGGKVYVKKMTLVK